MDRAALEVRARVALWRGAATTKDSGLQAVESHIALSCVELAGVPASPDAVEVVARALPQAMRLVANAVSTAGAEQALSLRVASNARARDKVRLFWVARTATPEGHALPDGHRALREMLFSSLPQGLRWIDHAGDPDGLLSLDFVESLVEVLKPEQWESSTLPAGIAPLRHYYSTRPWRSRGGHPAPERGWSAVLQAIAAQAGRGAVLDVTLVGGGRPTPTEAALVGAWIQGCDAWTRPQRVTASPPPATMMGGPRDVEIAPDRPASQCSEWWSAARAAYASPTSTPALHAIRVLSGGRAPAVDLARAACEYLLSPEVNPTFVGVSRDDNRFERARTAARLCAVSPAVCHPLWAEPDAPEALRRVHRMATPDELAGMWSIPVRAEDHGGVVATDEETWKAPGHLVDLLGASWWSETSADSVATPIGWAAPGAHDEAPAPQVFRLGDQAPHALIAGRSGMGKSTLLHALLCGLGARYHPDELTLYVFDLNPGGIELLAWSELPHAAVVTLGNEPAPAVAALEDLVAELKRREALLAQAGAFSRYRAQGRSLPRVVAVIDEYQVLFEDRACVARSAHALETLALQGRKFGVHLVLATQSLAADGMRALSTRAVGQFAVRIALPMNHASEAARVLFTAPEEIAKVRARGEALYADASTGGHNTVIRVARAESDAAWEALRTKVIVEARQRFGGARAAVVGHGQASNAQRTATEIDRVLPRGPWCQESTAGELVAVIGEEFAPNAVSRARGDVGQRVELRFGNRDPHALVAGTSGSGKSSLLHAMILSLCTRYSPSECRLYLLDMKPGGVEFSAYRRLRHAEFVALGATPSVAIAVLRQLERDMEGRGERFADAGDDARSLETYRKITGADLPRMLVVIDEFQRLFGDREASEAASVLREVARLGRSAGLHLVLATQSIGAQELVRHLDSGLLGQCTIRVSMRMTTDVDAARVLTGDPEPVRLLQNSGEAVVEVSRAQQFVRVAYGESDEAFSKARRQVLQRLADLNDAHFRAPRVFSPSERPVFADVLLATSQRSAGRRIPVCFGERLDGALDPAVWSLSRTSDAHLLVVGSDGARAQEVIVPALACLSTQRGPGCRRVIAFVLDDDAEYSRIEGLGGCYGADLEVKDPADLRKTLEDLEKSLDNGGGSLDVVTVILLFGTHGHRTLSPKDRGVLKKILELGPGHGVFVIGWSGGVQDAKDFFDGSMVARAFATKVLLGEQDVRALLPSVTNIEVERGQVVLHHASRPAEVPRVRLLARVDEWIQQQSKG